MTDATYRPSLSMLGWALNEEQNLGEYVDRAEVFLRSVSDDFELILIDDGSSDSTWALAGQLQASRPWLKPLKNDGNRGPGYCYRRGISAATKDYFMAQTVDWAYDIDAFRPVFSELQRYDILQGIRPGEFSIGTLRRRSDSLYKGIVSLTNYALIRILFQLPFADFQNVTVCPTRLARPLDLESEGSFTNPEVMMKLYWGGASFLQVPVVFQKRGRGKGTGTRVRAVVTSIADIIGSWFRWIVLGGYPNRKTGRVVPSQARASSSADVPVVHANEPAARGRREAFLIGPPRSALRAAAYTALAFLCFWLLAAEWLSIERSPTFDRDALDLLNVAIHRGVCGATVSGTPSIDIARYAADGGELQIIPVRSLIVDKAGSLDIYCRATSDSPVPGRSALLLLETSLVRMRPQISVAGVGKALHFIRVAGILPFVFVLMSAGYGLAIGCTAILVGVWLLVTLSHHLYSAAAFGPVLLLQTVALWVLAARYRWAANVYTCAALGIAAAAWAAIVVNLRPDYLTLEMAMPAAFLICDHIMGTADAPGQRMSRWSLLLSAFATSYLAFHYGFFGSGTATGLPMMSGLSTEGWMRGLVVCATATTLIWFVRSRSIAALVPALLSTAICLLSLPA
ncbi:MAG: hypothetical protein DMF95_09910 [Acidobacteria bacterium]|nr:MAG: hypothetical protein DMF95_09910 [Acidobacteriota bacterium]